MRESDIKGSKIPHGLEIITTISIENKAKSNKNLGLVLRAIFYADYYDTFNPCVMLEPLTSPTPIRNQALEQVKVNLRWP